MPKIIITAAEDFNDVETLACGIAYRELLALRGIDSDVVFACPFNETVTPLVKSLSYSYKKILEGDPSQYDYVLVDNSDPSSIAKFVPHHKVIALFDHRWGFEDQWGDSPKIQINLADVGSCATLIWEEYKKYGFADKIGSISANLLYIGLISNTLDLKAQITHQRDLRAEKELGAHITLPKSWKKQYFDELSVGIFANPESAIINDSKARKIKNKDFYIMQVELWNSSDFIKSNEDLILNLIKNAGHEYAFLTSASISEECTYLVSNDSKTQQMLEKAINAKFTGNIGKADKLWLRKEIIKALSH